MKNKRNKVLSPRLLFSNTKFIVYHKKSFVVLEYSQVKANIAQNGACIYSTYGGLSTLELKHCQFKLNTAKIAGVLMNIYETP